MNNEYLIDKLVAAIPEYADYILPEYERSAFMIFSDFGIYLRDAILNKSEPELINRCFTFINSLFYTSDERVIDMLKVTTLEVLTDSPVTIQMSREKLNEYAKSIFESVLAFLKNDKL